jgi:hypothetical protein
LDLLKSTLLSFCWRYPIWALRCSFWVSKLWAS